VIFLRLAERFEKGFDPSNLRRMCQFYVAFPICDAVRHDLSRLVLPTEAELVKGLMAIEDEIRADLDTIKGVLG
jgi:hypothetical protein